MQTERFSNAVAESLWVYHLNISCCSLEANSASGPRFDWERFGCRFVKDHRNADVLLVSGPVTAPIVDDIKKIYNEMRSPKFVISSGSCASTGGMFSISEKDPVAGLDKHIPVDIFIPGCPPRPESLIHALLQLQESIGVTYAKK